MRILMALGTILVLSMVLSIVAFVFHLVTSIVLLGVKIAFYGMIIYFVYKGIKKLFGKNKAN